MMPCTLSVSAFKEERLMTLTDTKHQRHHQNAYRRQYPRQQKNQTTPPFPEGSEELAWLRLACAYLSPARLTKLVQNVESPLELFDKSFQRTYSRAAGSDKILKKLQDSYPRAEQALRWSEGENCHLIVRNTEQYPRLLRQIVDPPAVLFVRGNPEVLHTPQLAIVGSRKASPPARSITRRWASELSQQGFSITSGLARGIDAAAHLGCLDNAGTSIAVLASGPELCYPKTHTQMLDNLMEQGASATEFPPTTQPVPRNFPQRNRIISGLSLGTLIIEAEARSGSLVTARLAMEQDREVFAMPGSVMNPLASGCHQLIQQGAKLVHQISDIVEELVAYLPVAAPAKADTGQSTDTTQSMRGDDTTVMQSLLNAVGFEPFTANALAEQTGADISVVVSELLLLELAGKLAALGDGRYVRI